MFWLRNKKIFFGYSLIVTHLTKGLMTTGKNTQNLHFVPKNLERNKHKKYPLAKFRCYSGYSSLIFLSKFLGSICSFN